MTSLTEESAVRALNKLLSGDWMRPNARSGSNLFGPPRRIPKVRFFHKVLFRHKLLPARKNAFSSKLEKENQLSRAPVLYLCLCQNEIILVDPIAKWAPYPMTPQNPEGLNDNGSSTTTTNGVGVGALKQNPCIILIIPYLAISEVVADTLREEVFGIGIGTPHVARLPYDVPEALRFSCSFRKQLIEELQICHNVHSMITKNRAITLPVRFAPLAMNPKRALVTETPSDTRLATFQFFSKGRLPDEYNKQKVVFRADYIFMGPEQMIDRYEALPNRPCSTYFIDPQSEEAKKTTKGAPSNVHRLITKFLPPRNLSDMGSLTRARDALGQQALPTGDDEDMGIGLSQAGYSELEFQFWVESIAQALAMNENSSDRYFIPEKGPYLKKLNVLNDKASWTCFRAHIFTPTRQIGVIGCRRKFLPPHLDSFQDMLFVLYGPERHPIIRPDLNFMSLLESVVDSLSPAVAPLPFKEAEFARCNPTLLSDHPYKAVHPTYCDRDLIQARANTLLYTSEQFRWIATRSWLTDAETALVLKDSGTMEFTNPRAATPGVVPNTKFIDLECFDLAMKFCDSVLSKLSLSAQNAKSPTEAKKGVVADPLAIIFRMMAELDQDGDDGSAGGSSGSGNGMRRNVDDVGDTPSGYSLKEEWKCRVAQYFAYCVDGGLIPSQLTLIKLAQAKPVDDKAAGVINEVIDFLLYMKQKPRSLKRAPNGYPFVPMKSVIERITTTDILNSFTCNEDVLIKLLLGNYFESVAVKAGKQEVVARLFRSILVTKLYNLKLVRVVCEKIATTRYVSDEILIDPLLNLVKIGNFYVKAWAFKALATLAANPHESAIFERGGVGMAIWTVYTSRTSDLIEAALDLLIAVSHTNKLSSHPYVVLTQPDLARKLIHLLAPFADTPQQERFHPRVLERAATLIIKLAPEKSVLQVLMENGAHNHLCAIVKKHHQYHHILVKVTSAIGTIYLHAGASMTAHRYSRKESQREDADALVSALKQHINASKLQLCLNILIILRMMLDFHMIPVPAAGLSNKRYGQAIQDRMSLYAKIRDDHSLDLKLKLVKSTASEAYDQAKAARLASERHESYAQLSAEEKIARRSEFDKQMKIAKGIVAKCDWFDGYGLFCRTHAFQKKHLRLQSADSLSPLQITHTDLDKPQV